MIRSVPGFAARGAALSGTLLALALPACREAGEPFREAAPRARPNLVLVSVDTLRADRLSAYGYGRDTSPFLEQLASEAVLFENFYYNGGGTLPSHMSLFTSLHPATHGIGPESAKTLEPERTTLAEVLSDRGYATGAFTDGGWMAGKFGFSQGFATYGESGGGLGSALPSASKWLDERDTTRPFFLFLHTYDVHSAWNELPYDCPGDAELHFAGTAPPGYSPCRDGECASRRLASANTAIRSGRPLEEIFDAAQVRYISDLYDGCIRWVDSRLGTFFDELRSRELWEDTVLVILSDHGEEFGEHGQFLHDQGGYEELARIPLIVKPAGPRVPGKRVSGLAAMVDVLPTLLELLEIEPPATSQGASLREAMTSGRTRRPNVHMYSVLRDEGWKYFSDERRLFDLTLDRRELVNRQSDLPDRVAAMERTVRALIEVDHAAAREFERRAAPSGTTSLTAEERERLRSLGYLR
jgi:arylsulfatase A-like enzyme